MTNEENNLFCPDCNTNNDCRESGCMIDNAVEEPTPEDSLYTELTELLTKYKADEDSGIKSHILAHFLLTTLMSLAISLKRNEAE